MPSSATSIWQPTGSSLVTHLIAADLLAAVGEYVGAGFGGREQDVVDGLLVDADTAQGVAENPAHHRDVSLSDWNTRQNFTSGTDFTRSCCPYSQFEIPR